MLTLDKMNKVSDLLARAVRTVDRLVIDPGVRAVDRLALDRGIKFMSRITKAALSPVHRFILPDNPKHKWTPNKEVTDSEAHSAMANIFQQGIRGCIRIDAVFLGVAVAMGLNFATAALVVALHVPLYTLWAYKVVGCWRTSSTNWMKVSPAWLVAISGIYASVALILAQINPMWYSNSVMFSGMMALWMAQIVPMENMVSRLAREAPVSG
jgi:hypothetical protein